MATKTSTLTFILAACLVGACAVSGQCAAPQAVPVDSEAAGASTMGTPALGLLVPAYFAPRGRGLTDWNQLIEAAGRVPIIAVLNLANGPGEMPDPDYTRLIERAGKTSLLLIGYVHSSYAKRPLQDVQRDVDAWIRLYPGIRGIFVDEQSAAPADVPYYAELRRHIREVRGLQVMVSNPGVVCATEYFSGRASDVICIYESDQPAANVSWPDTMTGAHPSAEVLLLAHGVASPPRMEEWIALAARRHVRHLYVTDDTGKNPWDRLPAYWDLEVAAVEKANAAAGACVNENGTPHD